MKPKEQTKPIEDKSNNQSKATIIFDDLINKRKKIMSEIHDSVDYNNLKFKYVGPTKDVSFYEYMDSQEHFNAIKHNKIKFSEVQNKQNNFLKKLNEVKIEVVDNLDKFYLRREETILRKTILKFYLMLIKMQHKMKLREKDLKY